jgi:hypothetical protein
VGRHRLAAPKTGCRIDLRSDHGAQDHLDSTRADRGNRDRRCGVPVRVGSCELRRLATLGGHCRDDDHHAARRTRRIATLDRSGLARVQTSRSSRDPPSTRTRIHRQAGRRETSGCGIDPRGGGSFAVFVYSSSSDAAMVVTAPAVDRVTGLKRTMLRDANVVVIVEPPRRQLEGRIRQALRSL